MANSALMFTALGDPTRQALFQRLGQGPASVGTLARGLPVTRPAVSQHLKVLKEAGLVQSRAAGTRRIYQLDPRGVEAMRGYLDLLWGRALDALKTLSEEETP